MRPRGDTGLVLQDSFWATIPKQKHLNRGGLVSGRSPCLKGCGSWAQCARGGAGGRGAGAATHDAGGLPHGSSTFSASSPLSSNSFQRPTGMLAARALVCGGCTSCGRVYAVCYDTAGAWGENKKTKKQKNQKTHQLIPSTARQTGIFLKPPLIRLVSL
jgi:hypothetical protein